MYVYGNNMNPHSSSQTLPRAAFPVTRWSVVLAARDRGEPESDRALEILCRTYWHPLYAFARSCGWGPADAQDLTQEFFARLLEKHYLKVVEPEKGRFRTFLRMALKRFLANEHKRLHASKRGGNQRPIVFDSSLAEERFIAGGAISLPPDRLYDRHWALALLDEAMGRLTREYSEAGKVSELAALKPHLTTERGSIPYDQIAAVLGRSEGAARVSLHRLRHRFRELFRETIADTVTSPEEAEMELREVLAVLSESV